MQDDGPFRKLHSYSDGQFRRQGGIRPEVASEILPIPHSGVVTHRANQLNNGVINQWSAMI
jgi:hypothetical protein